MYVYDFLFLSLRSSIRTGAPLSKGSRSRGDMTWRLRDPLRVYTVTLNLLKVIVYCVFTFWGSLPPGQIV